MKRIAILLLVTFCAAVSIMVAAEPPEVSEATETCLMCHEGLHPGIVASWRESRHSRITPGTATRVSSAAVPDPLQEVVVGCAECHLLRPDEHADTFEHNDYRVHVVVSPKDCAVCHEVESEQYAGNIMAHAYGNLKNNTLYQDLQRNLLGRAQYQDGKLSFLDPHPNTEAQGCLYCHGTKLQLTGTETRETDFGEMTFPVIAGWPNQGVGRINLDGSMGACTPCHTRHDFSIATARKPYTCKECHVGPDVPVYKVYSASKHGNIFHSKEKDWNFDAVPWTVGEDFTAPTCAACHVSELDDPEGEVVARRTHRMNDRIANRIFGLVYSHAHPKIPDTTVIRSKDGLPLPTALDGTPASEYLIGPEEQARRQQVMKQICLSCHGRSWVEGHFARYDQAIDDTNAATLVATRLLLEAWEKGYAEGPAAGGSPFDEAVERQWADIWLFYANSIRFTSAMAGGGDYAVFADGYYSHSQGLAKLHQWLKEQDRSAEPDSD